MVFNKTLSILSTIIAFFVTICASPQPPAPGFEYVGYGANYCVSGSLHTLTSNGETIILDAGSFYGTDAKYKISIPAKISKNAAAVIISHAHLDHTGRLLELVQQGYQGPIYCSKPTMLLLPVMLKMAAGFSDLGPETFVYSQRSWEENQKQKRDTPVHLACEYTERIHASNRRTLTAKRPELVRQGFYLCRYCAEAEVAKVMQQVQALPLHTPTLITHNFLVEFFLTPHLPGSVMIKVTNPANGYSLLYTGDFGSGNSPYLKTQEEVPSADWMILEGTYGPKAEQELSQLDFQTFLGTQIRQGKRVIIPAFALDRTQQVLGAIFRGMQAGLIPLGTPVKIFSPTAWELNELYRSTFRQPNFQPYFSQEFMEQGPFAPIYTKGSGLAVAYGEIALCTSGMADSAHARQFVKAWIEDPKTTFVFVSFQDQDSLGGRLLRKPQQLTIDGKSYQPQAEVYQFNCFSGHGQPEQIMQFLQQIKGLKGIVLVHSPAALIESLCNFYQKAFPGLPLLVPKSGRRYDLRP